MRTEQEWQEREKQLLTRNSDLALANQELRQQVESLSNGYLVRLEECNEKFSRYLETERLKEYALQERIVNWVKTKIGIGSMHPRERSMRILEETVELAQREGIPEGMALAMVRHVYSREAGDGRKEAGAIGFCLMAWCAASNLNLMTLIEEELKRNEAKPMAHIEASLLRKRENNLLTYNEAETEDDGRTIPN